MASSFSISAARRIAATRPKDNTFLGYSLQFASVRDTKSLPTTLPLNDVAMVEGLPDNTSKSTICNSLKELGLPLPGKVFIDRQSAYLQYDDAEGKVY